MKREIKFRGMTLSGQWVYGLLTIANKNGYKLKDVFIGDHFISNSAGLPYAYKVRPETIGQWTGMSTQDDNDIYEEDIFEYWCKDENIEPETDTVEYSCGAFVGLNSGCFISVFLDSGEFKIIGNIHEQTK